MLSTINRLYSNMFDVLFFVPMISLFVSAAVPATFKMSLKSQEAEEGKSVTLYCELSKKGVPVQWQKEGQLLSEEISQGKYQIKLEGKKAMMTIFNTQPEDAGKYCCITGDEKTTAEVRVKRKTEKDKFILSFSYLAHLIKSKCQGAMW